MTEGPWLKMRKEAPLAKHRRQVALLWSARLEQVQSLLAVPAARLLAAIPKR